MDINKAVDLLKSAEDTGLAICTPGDFNYAVIDSSVHVEFERKPQAAYVAYIMEGADKQDAGVVVRRDDQGFYLIDFVQIADTSTEAQMLALAHNTHIIKRH